MIVSSGALSSPPLSNSIVAAPDCVFLCASSHFCKAGVAMADSLLLRGALPSCFPPRPRTPSLYKPIHTITAFLTFSLNLEVTCGFCVLSYHADVVVLFPFLSIRYGLVWLEGLGAEIIWQDWNLLAMDLGWEDIIPSGRLVLQPKSVEVFDVDFGLIRQSVSVCELAAQVGHISSLYRISFDLSKSCLVSLLSSQIWRESLVLSHEWCAKFFLEIISTLHFRVLRVDFLG